MPSDKTVEELFTKFEQAGDRAYKTKRRLADEIITELSIHAAIVEQVFYPATREALGEQLDEPKKSAPTRPDPAAPDEPPGNMVAGGVAAVMDAGKDAVRGVKEEIGRRRG